MVTTEIQLPDEVFARAKEVCEAREISLAELTRLGLEHILSHEIQESPDLQEWRPPPPRRLGWMGLDDAGLKAQAQWPLAEKDRSNVAGN